MSTPTGPQNPPPVPPEPQPPAPAPAPPLRDAVVLLAVLVVLLAVGAGAYLAYAHPGSREPLMAGGAVAAVLVPLTYATLRR
ncbi:hypothetical protein [Streptomyces sp. NPDC058653]|uniref:hypothetical protein n=1 Tax=Streptomyces sp. NPDC058653 TaxID=3346576 RepID=UPI00365F1458